MRYKVEYIDANGNPALDIVEADFFRQEDRLVSFYEVRSADYRQNVNAAYNIISFRKATIYEEEP